MDELAMLAASTVLGAEEPLVDNTATAPMGSVPASPTFAVNFSMDSTSATEAPADDAPRVDADTVEAIVRKYASWKESDGGAVEDAAEAVSVERTTPVKRRRSGSSAQGSTGVTQTTSPRRRGGEERRAPRSTTDTPSRRSPTASAAEGAPGEPRRPRSKMNDAPRHSRSATSVSHEQRELRNVFRHTQKILRHQVDTLSMRDILQRSTAEPWTPTIGAGTPLASLGPKAVSVASRRPAQEAPATAAAAAAMALTNQFLSNVQSQKQNALQRLFQRERTLSQASSIGATSFLEASRVGLPTTHPPDDSNDSVSEDENSTAHSGTLRRGEMLHVLGSDTEETAHIGPTDSSGGVSQPVEPNKLLGATTFFLDPPSGAGLQRVLRHAKTDSSPSSTVELVIEDPPAGAGTSSTWSRMGSLTSPLNPGFGSQSKRLLRLQGDSQGFADDTSLSLGGVLGESKSALSRQSIVEGDGRSGSDEEESHMQEEEHSMVQHLVRRHEMWKSRRLEGGAAPVSELRHRGEAEVPCASGHPDAGACERSPVNALRTGPDVTADAAAQALAHTSSATGRCPPTIFRSVLSVSAKHTSSLFFNLSQDEMGHLRRVNSFENTSTSHVVVFKGASKAPPPPKE